MAGNPQYPSQIWTAREVHFIELEKIADMLELQPGSWAEADAQINKHVELQIKLHQAVTRNSQERELHDQKLKQGQEIAAMIRDQTAENTLLIIHVNKLKQKVAQVKMSRKDEEVIPELRNTVINQEICLQDMRNELNELQEQRNILTVKLDGLIAQKKATQESISTCTAAVVTLQVSLKELQKSICEKDTQIQQMCMCLKTALNKISACNISKLIWDWKQLFDEMRKRQGHMMGMLKLCKEKKIPELLQSAPGSVTEKYQPKNLQAKRFIQRCAQSLLKLTETTLCSLCVLMLMASLIPHCSRPNYDLFTMLCELVESCGDNELALPSVI